MDVTKARQIVSETAAGRARWGKLFTSGYSEAELLDALVVLDQEIGFAALADHDELVKTKRQLTAALAREGKQKKRIESLTAELVALEERYAANSGS